MKLLPEKLSSANFRSYMVGKGHIGARSHANPDCPDSGRQTMQAMVSCVSQGTGNVSGLKQAGMWHTTTTTTTLFLWSSDNGGPQFLAGQQLPSVSVTSTPHLTGPQQPQRS